jgi:hypothetical protein
LAKNSPNLVTLTWINLLILLSCENRNPATGHDRRSFIPNNHRVQGDQIGKMFAYWVTILGPFFQMVHVWWG